MGFMSSNLVVLSTCFYRAFLRYRTRQRTRAQTQNINPVAPAPEPPEVNCTCMTNDHITPLTLTEISTTYTTWRSNSRSQSERGTDPRDMLDSYDDSANRFQVRKSNVSPWSFSSNSSRSQVTEHSASNTNSSSSEVNFTSVESLSYDSHSVNGEEPGRETPSDTQGHSRNSSKEQSSSGTPSYSSSSASE